MVRVDWCTHTHTHSNVRIVFFLYVISEYIERIHAKWLLRNYFEAYWRVFVSVWNSNRVKNFSKIITTNLKHSCLLISAVNAILLDAVCWCSVTRRSPFHNNNKNRWNSNIQTLKTINCGAKLFQIVYSRFVSEKLHILWKFQFFPFLFRLDYWKSQLGTTWKL